MTLSNNDQEAGAGSETYSRIFRFFPDAVSLTRVGDGILLDINKAFEQLTGYRREEVIGRKTAALGCWLEPAQWDEACRLLEETGEARDLDTRVQRKDGGIACALITLSRIEIDEATCYLVVFREVLEPKQVGRIGKGWALERIPRWSRETVQNVMEFYSHLAGMITELSYRNVRLSKALVERKQAEEALRESEEKFSKSFRATPSVLSISTISDGRYIEVNESFERSIGYSREEVLGRTSLELNIWESPQMRARFLDLFRKDGKVHDMDARFRHKNGDIIEGQLSAEIVEIGKEQYLLTLVQDVTARKRAEEALKVSEAEKSLILNSTIDMVIYHDRDMKMLWGNKKALDSAGIPLEELVGRHCWEIWHQGDQACDGCPVVSARDTGEPQEAEIRSPDGRHWYIRGYPVKDADGRVTGVVEFCLNITERKRTELALLESERLLESEKRFRSLFENLLEGVAYCRMEYDDDGEPADFVYLDVNGAFSQLIRLRDAVGKRVSELIPGIKESCPELFEVYGRVALTGRPEKFEVYLEPLSLWRSMSVYSTEKGYFVAVSENITERKRIEGELRDSHFKLRQLTANLNLRREQERKAIARRVHDELGTAFTLMKFDLAWLKRHYPPDDSSVAERIGGMEELIHEGTQTVQRITSELRPSLLDEQGLAATIEWKAKEFEQRTGISCRLKIDAEIPALTQDQAINAFRILQETLSNVIRHARATSVEISLVKTAGRVFLRMADNGVGITNQEIAAPTSYGILGMEERARLCGGDITIEGIPGKGTTIQISIPA